MAMRHDGSNFKHWADDAARHKEAERCWPLELGKYAGAGGKSAWDSTGDRAQGG